MNPQKLTLLTALLLPACALDDAELGRGHLEPVASQDAPIIGGTPERIQDSPWQVSLTSTLDGGHSCGGSIIDRWHVLTARHCFEASSNNAATLGSPRNAKVIAGTADLDDLERAQIVEIDDVVPIVDGYDGSVSHGKDILLVRLAQPLHFNRRVQPIEMATREDERAGLLAPGTVAKVAGWGWIAEGGPFSQQLLAVDLEIVPFSDFPIDPEDFISEEEVLAARGVPGKDKCVGDSGSPLVVKKGNKYIQAGIVSFGFEPCGVGNPGGFARVPAFAEALEHALCESQTVIKKKGKLSGGVGEENMRFIAVDVPAGFREVNFNLFGGTGDVDMFIKRGARPSEDDHDCRSQLVDSNNETCNFAQPGPGRYWIGLLGFVDYEKVKLQVNGYGH